MIGRPLDDLLKRAELGKDTITEILEPRDLCLPLVFADDSLIFFKATSEGFRVVKMSLEIYARASRQMVNFEKSDVCFGKSIEKEMEEDLASLLGV